MEQYLNIVRADYLQRFRSYSFMVTLFVSVIAAYYFVPAPEDPYTTVRAGQYVGYDNAAWIGHSTAMITSVFLWFIGFFLINNGIKRDQQTGVGQIIATTSITNFQYLFAKALANFLVLLTIAAIVFLMALGLAFFRATDYEFSLAQFALPHLLATLPSIFFLSALAVLFEVIFGLRTNLMNVAFICVVGLVIAQTNSGAQSDSYWLDPMGVKYLSTEIQSAARRAAAEPGQELPIALGFNYSKSLQKKFYLFEGSSFGLGYVLSRLLWFVLAFAATGLSAVLFKRFDTQAAKPKKKPSIVRDPQTDATPAVGEIKLEELAPVTPNFSILPLVRTELTLLLRQGPKWFWLVNAGLFIALWFVPLPVGLSILLPILWFLQVNRWSDVATKEEHHGTDNFVYSTYQPLRRLLVSQILAAALFAAVLALPLVARLLVVGQAIVALQVVLGAVVLVAYAVSNGIVWGGKRFFEATFFLLTYLIVSGVTVVHYGGVYDSGVERVIWQLLIGGGLLGVAFFVRGVRVRGR